MRTGGGTVVQPGAPQPFRVPLWFFQELVRMVHDPQYRGAGNRGKSKRRLKTTPVLGQSPKHQLGNWPNSLSRARACGSPALLTKPSNEKSGSRHSLRGCHRGLSLAPFDLLKIFQQPPRREPRDRARLPVKARERIFNTRSIGGRLIASSPQIQHRFSSGSCSILADEELCLSFAGMMALPCRCRAASPWRC